MNQSTLSIRQRTIVSWLIPLFLLVLFLFPIKGQADEGTLNFYVTPEFPESQVEGSKSYFDLNLAEGETETLTLKLQNASNEPIKVQVTPHTAYTNVHGSVEYGKDAEEPDPSLSYSLDELIDPSGVIELTGQEIKTITVPLHMPEEGVAIKNEFAYVIGIVVSNSRDSVQPDLDLLDVFADQLNYRNVISATIQNFTPTFVNRMAVEATVQRVGEDDVLYEASEEMMQMAPNSHFDFPISLEGDRFQSGEYVLNLKATSGEEEWVWEQSFTIEGAESRTLNRADVTIDTTINWWMVGSSVLICLLLGIVLYLIFQRRKSYQNKS